MERRDRGGPKPVGGQAGRRRRWRPQGREPVQRFRRREHGVRRRARHADRQLHQTSQHVDEQAGQRQVGPVGVGGDVEQHDPPGAPRLLGDQRRAVGQRRPAMLRQGGGGLGQHLSGHLDLVGYGEAGERRGVAEGGETGGLAPRQRPAKLPFPREQTDRQQRIRLVGLLLGHARSGEADQQPAVLDEAGDRIAFLAGRQRPIGQDQHGEVARQQGFQVALPHLGVRREGAAEIEQRSRERRFGGGEIAGDQPDGTQPPALVEQQDLAGRGRSLEHQPGEPVAQLRRQGDRDFGRGGAGRHLDRCARQRAAVAALRQHARLACRRLRHLGEARHQPIGLRAWGQQHAHRRRVAAQFGDGAGTGQRPGEVGIGRAVVQAVAEIGDRRPGVAPAAQRGR